MQYASDLPLPLSAGTPAPGTPTAVKSPGPRRPHSVSPGWTGPPSEAPLTVDVAPVMAGAAEVAGAAIDTAGVTVDEGATPDDELPPQAATATSANPRIVASRPCRISRPHAMLTGRSCLGPSSPASP